MAIPEGFTGGPGIVDFTWGDLAPPLSSRFVQGRPLSEQVGRVSPPLRSAGHLCSPQEAVCYSRNGPSIQDLCEKLSTLTTSVETLTVARGADQIVLKNLQSSVAALFVRRDAAQIAREALQSSLETLSASHAALSTSHESLSERVALTQQGVRVTSKEVARITSQITMRELWTRYKTGAVGRAIEERLLGEVGALYRRRPTPSLWLRAQQWHLGGRRQVLSEEVFVLSQKIADLDQKLGKGGLSTYQLRATQAYKASCTQCLGFCEAVTLSCPEWKGCALEMWHLIQLAGNAQQVFHDIGVSAPDVELRVRNLAFKLDALDLGPAVLMLLRAVRTMVVPPCNRSQ